MRTAVSISGTPLATVNAPMSSNREGYPPELRIAAVGLAFRWLFFLINQGAGDTVRAVADPVVLHSLKCEVISASARCSHLCASIKYFELCTGSNTAN